MLRSTSISAIMTMVEKLIQTNVVICPKPQTPLSEIVMKCYSPSLNARVVDSDGSDKKADGALETLQDLSWMLRNPPANLAPVEAPCHGDFSESFVRTLAESVRGNITVARNVVTPMINSIVDLVETRRKNNQTTIASTLAVVQDNFEDIWSSPALDSLVERFKDSPAHGDVELFDVHPMLSEEQVIAMMHTGVSRFDKELDDWIEQVGRACFVEVYSRYFVPRTDNETGARLDPSQYGFNIHWLGTNGYAARNDYLAVHLIARSLLENIPEGVDMSADEYRLMMAGVLEQTGRTICRLFDERENDRENRRLVIQWPMQNAEFRADQPTCGHLVVNGDVYTQWLSEGGTPEILLGSSVTDREMGFGTLIEKREHYESSWKYRMTVVRSAQNSREFSVVLSALRDALTQCINDMPDAQITAGSRGDMHVKLATLLENVYINDVAGDSIYRTVRKLVCSVLFANRDVRTILDNMEGVAKIHADLDVREVALLATIELLTLWFAGLIDIKRNPILNTHDGALVTGLTLVNIVQLIEDVVVQVAGDDIADKLNGEDIYSSTIADTVAASLQSKLVPSTTL